MEESDYDLSVHLRLCEPEDIYVLYTWANDEMVRKNAFHTEPISFEDHRNWFKRVMEDDDELQFIMENAEGPIGQARLTVTGSTAEIDYSIAPQKRGMGYGRQMILLLLDKVRAEYKCIDKLVAKVKPQNAKSSVCFIKNGFTETYRQYELTMQERPEEKETR